ncbi:SAVED domain-containing protein [Mesorhizobium sp. M0340]|uniref:SAVED domain-containing protein n=1 Tax=Mesorhizobium sp. M0340 TaxID=2956939 RepID=UPI00333C9F7E
MIGDLVSGNAKLNTAYIAHIISDASGGPRGNSIDSPRLSKEPDNLMLMCDPHHREVDGSSTWRNYSVERLQDMKRAHEVRIATNTAIDPSRACHVIRFAANIGRNESPVALDHIKTALLPDRYPAEGGWIDLDVPDLGIPDHDDSYWSMHRNLLRQKYSEKIRGRLERGEINRLTVFALAPIPLLVELGRLISDISDAEVRQLLREPKGWAWDGQQGQLNLSRREADSRSDMVALKLEVSGMIDNSRVAAVLGDRVSIWSISAEGAHNDIMRTAEDLRHWRQQLRRVLEAIKDRHGEAKIVHVFPAVPVSAAVEIGRVWMPKAHIPMRIYDQNRAKGGFFPALDVIHEQGESGR